MPRHVALVSALALAGCTDDLVSAETSETETSETGEPVVECDEPPRVFGEPLGMWAEQSGTDFSLDHSAIASGGDLVWVNALELGRWDHIGQPRWEQSASADTDYSAVGVTADDEIVVVGATSADDSQLVIERFDRDGVLLDRASFEHTPGAAEAVWGASVSPRGDVLAEIWLRDLPDGQPSRQLVYIDRELDERWSDPPKRFIHMGLDFDADDRAYALYLDFANPPPDPSSVPSPTVAWPITLSARDAEGNVLWAATDELLAQTIPRLQLAVGDRVYLYFSDPHLVLSQTDSLIRAYDFDGSLTWELALDYEVEIHAIAASPCGGLYLAGLANEPEGAPSMAIWSLEPNGERGPFTRVPLPNDARINRVLVSPLDEVIVRGTDDFGNLDWMLGY